MSKFEVLCVTMKQTDFSKIEQMNINSDVVFANQSDCVKYEELDFGGYTAKMITTNTKGVGINRNLALTYASADICLFADDDVCYYDGYEDKIIAEFDKYLDADVFIFNFETDDEDRKQRIYKKTKKIKFWNKMPWAGFKIAVRLSSIRKSNVWFTTLFGGGATFPSGEDSMWLNDVKKKGLNIYVSKEIIGKVSFEKSTWFDGYDKKFYFGKGAYYQAAHPKTFCLWMKYFVWRTRKFGNMNKKDKIYWIKQGRKAFIKGKSFSEMIEC